jgi:heptosyltransferase-2
MKLLCICPIGIGNYLLFYPAVQMLKACRPDLEIHLLALRKAIKEFAEGDPLWSDIHVMDPSKIRGAAQKISYIKQLASNHFDVSLSYFPSNRWEYNVLPFLCQIKERYAFHYHLKRIGSFSFLNNRLLPVDPALHDLHQNIHLSSLFLHKDLHDRKLVFPQLFSSQDLKKASDLLSDSLPIKIALHPGSSIEHGMDAKRWDPEHFGSLADRICNKLGAEALIFGGPDEFELKKSVASVMNQPHRCIDPVSLKLTSALISTCTLCLCNDSGLMHCAAVMGIPVAAVFGPTDERRNGPVGNGHLILRKQMNGFPLWTARNVGVRYVPEGCDPSASIKALSVEDAWSMVEPWLDTIGEGN